VILRAHENKFIGKSLDSARYILIQCGMAGLEDRGVVFLAPHKQVCRVYLPDVEDSVDGNFD